MTKQEFLIACEESFSKNGIFEYATPENLENFYNLTIFMLETNKKMNLTALRDENSVISRHITDCLLAAKHLPKGKIKVLDVGSGGGMPCLPFAIVRPDIEITALDATAKKTAYIAAAAEHLGLKNVHILTGRAEELGANPKHREMFDVVCARAVAELRVLMEWCIPFLKKDGIFLSLKGKNAETELTNAANAVKKLSCSLILNEKQELIESEESEISERHNFVFKKAKNTDKLYPRRNAQIMKNPL
ncbi:MAG: 16S rRNA (guanine(527)-N(7))-methyltransferase RsmG [Clostridia bacterium]|nr:16S rRNA (guanine(527)-N(7))-methyltransferase RsmG [Clostridia bacterium]